MSVPLLELSHVTRSFGGVHATRDVSLTLKQGEVIGLIGPNGAGKSTLVNVITGVHPPSSGQIMHNGERIDGMKPFQVAARGIARTFQVVQPFPAMTVIENVMAGSLFGSRIRSMSQAREAAAEHLRFTGLLTLAERPASELTLANRKRLELAKSLAMSPKLLMLDEVNAGLNTAEVDQALELIRKIAATGVTVLIIEHLLKVVLTLCSRVIVLHHGELIADDTPSNIVRNEAVIKAYLGARFAEKYRDSHE
ncbi:ABC transporter ATP-binding protein [Variovorax sp. VNK109]|uniref:ABC transporter ATP-binding protein n=1 Tax=Variovorax sp. VNK109 TaxID=3400919 RepID=UPI003C00BCCC